jgi:hypothetical protein
MLVFVAAAPLVLVRAARDLWAAPAGGRVRAVLPTAAPAVAALLTAGAAFGFHKWYDRTSPGWEGFEAYNAARGKLLDFQAGSGTAELAAAYRAVGWRPEDGPLLCNWGLIDRRLFSPENITAVAAAVQPRPSPAVTAGAVWTAARADAVNRLLVGWSVVLLLFLAPTRAAWLGYLGVVAAVWGVWFVIARYGHAPPYVFHACQVPVLWTGLALSGSVPNPRRLALAAALLLAADGAAAYRGLRARSKAARADARTVAELVRVIDPRPDRMYVLWGDAFPYQWMAPWTDLTRFAGLKGYPLSCTTNTPHADARLAEFRIDNPAAALYERPDEVLLLCRPGQAHLLGHFLVRHHGKVVSMDLAPGPARPLPGGRVEVYRCRLLGTADQFMTEEWVRNAR